MALLSSENMDRGSVENQAYHMKKIMHVPWSLYSPS